MYTSIPQTIGSISENYRWVNIQIGRTMNDYVHIRVTKFVICSPISTPLGSMASSCLQQRESYHPYMFHDPLSLSAQYAAHPSSRHACNPNVAHQQPHSQHGNYATPGSIGSNSNLNSSTASTGKISWLSRKKEIQRKFRVELSPRCTRNKLKNKWIWKKTSLCAFPCLDIQIHVQMGLIQLEELCNTTSVALNNLLFNKQILLWISCSIIIFY